jgi:8-oxo-dGTP diphosphatase
MEALHDMSTILNVVVAVITDAQQRVLITRRALSASSGGLWEFPGGKLEAGEQPTAALIREIKEEVGLDILGYDYLGEVRYVYKHQPISLLVYHVHRYHGEAVCCETQLDLRWVDLVSLNDFHFPAANIEIIEMIRKI